MALIFTLFVSFSSAYLAVTGTNDLTAGPHTTQQYVFPRAFSVTSAKLRVVSLLRLRNERTLWTSFQPTTLVVVARSAQIEPFTTLCRV